MTRIYTKLGDDGSTGLLFGGRVSKADPLIEIIGTLDEAVAALGQARAVATGQALRATILRVQRDLFVVAADLVANPRARDRLEPGVSLVTAEMIAAVEARIDQELAAGPLPEVFIVPGETVESAALDVARTVIRRAERRLAERMRRGTAEINVEVSRYLNRLSDLVYVLARSTAGRGREPASR